MVNGELVAELSCSLIVRTCNHSQALASFLESVNQQIVLPNELIIIDTSNQSSIANASIVQLCKVLEDKKVILIYKHVVSDFICQRKQALAYATGKIIYFFDDTVILDSHYLSAMQTMFKEKNCYAGGMGKVTNKVKQFSRFTTLIRKIFLLPYNHHNNLFTASGLYTHPYALSDVVHVKAVDACCMAFRRAIFVKHAFDRLLCDDIDLQAVDFSYRISYYAPLFYNPYAILHYTPEDPTPMGKKDDQDLTLKRYNYLFFKYIYPASRWRILTYYWSHIGLFILSLQEGNAFLFLVSIRASSKYSKNT